MKKKEKKIPSLGILDSLSLSCPLIPSQAVFWVCTVVSNSVCVEQLLCMTRKREWIHTVKDCRRSTKQL